MSQKIRASRPSSPAERPRGEGPSAPMSLAQYELPSVQMIVLLFFPLPLVFGFPWWLRGFKKKSACNAGDPGCIPEWRRTPGERKWLPTPVFWRIPRTEEPGGLQSTGSQRVGHAWATDTEPCFCLKQPQTLQQKESRPGKAESVVGCTWVWAERAGRLRSL